MPFLIHGVFFQRRNDSVQEMFCFTGVIREAENGFDALLGEMRDHFSKAELTDVSLSPTKLTFQKTYLKKPYCDEPPIDYAFERQTDGTWLGNWNKKASKGEQSSGFARCVISEVSDAFFHSPDEAEELAMP